MVQGSVKDRPVLKLPRTKIEIGIEIAGLLGLAATVYLVATNWASLPDRVPHHFTWDGRPDAWGGKGVLIALPLIMAAVFAGLTALSRAPHIFNYPWPITPENAPVQYRLARTLMAWIGMVVVWLAVYITYTQIEGARGHNEAMGPWFLPATLLLIFGAIGAYFVMAGRRK